MYNKSNPAPPLIFGDRATYRNYNYSFSQIGLINTRLLNFIEIGRTVPKISVNEQNEDIHYKYHGATLA